MSNLTPDGKERMINDVRSKVGFNREQSQSDLDKLMMRYKTLTTSILEGSQIVRNAELESGRLPDKRALNELNMKQFIEVFNDFSKDELVHVMAVMHSKNVERELDTMGG